MAYLYFYWTLVAFLLLNTGVTGSEETPRERVDLRDDYWFRFMTRPDIHVPKYEVHIYDEDALAPGYWFIAPYENINKLKRGNPWEGPYIYDGHGDLIWAGTPAMDYYMVNDFRVTRYNNTDMLTGIMFRDNAALFLNQDSHYEQVKSVSWTSAWEFANMHEFHVVRNGTRALTTTRKRWTNLTLEESKMIGYHDGRCAVRADGVKEVDITVDPPKTLFEWVATEHIPLEESHYHIGKEEIKKECEKDWDIHHINSVDKFADDDYLISSKVLDTIYKVSHVDGSIVWRLGGRQSDFKMTPDVRFGNQHTPRIINETDTHLTISLFANSSPVRSRGIVIRLNYQNKTVELLQEAHKLPTEKPFDVNSRGSAQLLPNGNMFTCWANWARISEHAPDGKLLMFSYLKRDYANRDGNRMPTYRGYKFDWIGRPTQPPDVYSAAFASGKEGFVTRVFVSWNGATEVKQWKFYESNEDGTTLKEMETMNGSGFETGIRYEDYAKYVVVEALDSAGEAIGRHGEFDADYDYDGIIHADYSASSLTTDDDDDSDDDNHDVTDVGEPWITHTFDPISALAGFAICTTLWIAMKLRERRSSQRRKGPKYQPLESKDNEFFLDDGDEEEESGDIELKEHKRA